MGKPGQLEQLGLDVQAMKAALPENAPA